MFKLKTKIAKERERERRVHIFELWKEKYKTRERGKRNSSIKFVDERKFEERKRKEKVVH